MGAWGADNFGNDDAGDWIYELEVSKGLSAVLPPLELVVSNDSYLESPDCCIALAASEVVAAGLTGDYSRVPDEVKQWLGKKPQFERRHADLALKVVSKITSESELKELWEDSDSFDEWRAIQESLVAMLQSTAGN